MGDVVQFDDDLVNPHNRSGWKDLLGDVIPKTSGVGSPTLAVWRTQTRWFNYAAGEAGDVIYHIPHDWKPGSPMFLHAHWGHNGTDISGSLVLNCYLSSAKGHQQEAFSVEKQITLTVANLNITNTPRYFHRVDEVPLSVVGGSASLLDASAIEVDGLILMHFDATTIPTITGGSTKPFIFTFDIHYETDRLATRRRVPDFYGD
jgi:hypothetical protein